MPGTAQKTSTIAIRESQSKMKKRHTSVEFPLQNLRKRALVLLLAIFIPLTNVESAFAVANFESESRLTASTDSAGECYAWGNYAHGNGIKVLANSDTQIGKVQIYLQTYDIEGFDGSSQTVDIYSNSNNNFGNLLGTLAVTSHPEAGQPGLATYGTINPISLTSGNYYWLKMNFDGACVAPSPLIFNGTVLTLNLSGNRIVRVWSGNLITMELSIYMAIFSGPINSSPGVPTSVVATATGKRSATVSFAVPASNGGSAITSYTATSSPGGITKTLTQATGGTFTFDGLQPGTAYTFAVAATNVVGTSAAATSNSVKTVALDVASISSLSFTDDGTGTGGKIVWAGKNVDAVLYTGPANSYPGPFNYGAFSSGWNGRIRNLTAGTEYTVSLYAISADGVGESKSLTFKTSAALPVLAGAASATAPAQTDAAKLAQMITWVNENTFVPGEAANMSNLLTKFMAIETSPHRSFVKVPTSRVSTVVATSLTPKACAVVSASAKVNAGLVSALSGDKCTISYTVTGGSRAPATMVKDFVFAKFAK